MDNQPPQPNQVINPPAAQPPSAPAATPAKKRKLPMVLTVLAVLLLLGGASYGVYAWQHRKVTSLTAQTALLNSRVTALNKQVSNLQKGKTTTTTTPDPYAGWSSYTLKNEKSTFKYPSTWKLSDLTIANDSQDMVELTAPDGFYLNIDTVNLGHPSLDYPTTIIYSAPLTFINQSGYINYFTDTTGAANSIINAELSKSSSSVFGDLFNTKNLNPSGLFSISLGNKTTPITSASTIKTGADFTDTTLVLESVSY